MPLKKIFTLVFLLFCFLSLWAQKAKTIVHGVIRDAETKVSLAYASVVFEGLDIIVRTDIKGNFYLESDQDPNVIRCSYIGYETKTTPITVGKYQDLEIFMVESDSKLAEITIRPEKYSRKNNPAVDLIEEVFRHKDQNRKESLDFYSFEKYEKLRVDLNNITDEFRKKWYLKPFKFIFNNVDTNLVTQKVALPIYLRERVLDGYYQKDPTKQTAILRGIKQSGFTDENEEEDALGVDNEGVNAYLNSAFSDIDIYEPKILLLGTEFIGPLSGIANSIYRFYIVDTVVYQGKKYADVFFAPRNKADLAFMGNMLVALDSSYAVMKVEMGVPKEINLNYVSDLHIEQEFEVIKSGNTEKLMLVRDAVTVDLKILKKSKGRSLLSHKISYFQNYTLNIPIPDTLFKEETLLQKDTGKVNKRDEQWWESRRVGQLSRAEQFVEKMVDSMQQVPLFKFLSAVGIVVSTGYQRVGFIDIGSLDAFYSYNDIEGDRFRLGGRTNSKLIKPLILEAYGAYGLRDRLWKYDVGVTWSFNGKVPRAFPQNQISLTYEKYLRVPGLSLDGLSQDNTVFSLQRTANNRMLLNRTFKLEYKKEYKNQLSYNIALLHKRVDAAGLLLFELSGGNPDNPDYSTSINTAEAGLFVRYAPTQKFYNGANGRIAIPGQAPVFTFTFKNGFKGIGGSQFNFQKLVLTAEKRFMLAPLGYSDLHLTAGRIWGKVPYPMLEIHPANQTYFYDWYAYNLMNFIEFVSDQYATILVQHNLNGFILNKIPLVKKLQWRENFSAKVLFGALDQAHNPAQTAGLFVFPKDTEGNTLTHALGKKPYVELSVGLSNIFSLIRIDYVWRVNYTELPGAPKWGIRAMLSPKF